MIKALERQEVPVADATKQEQEDGDQTDELAPLRKTRTASTARAETPDAEGLGLQGLSRAFTGSTLVDTASSATTPSVDEDDLEGGPSVPRRKGAPAMGRMRKGSNLSMPKALSPSQVGSPGKSTVIDDSENDDDDNLQSYYEAQRRPGKRLVSNASESAAKSSAHGLGSKDPEIQEVVAEAMKELIKIRHKEQSAKPLRVVRQHPQHQPDEALRARFEQLAEDELKIRRLNAKDWLRVATWWLLKARYNTRLDDDPRRYTSRASFSVSSEGATAVNQAYVDLLKASWILYNVILHDDNISSLMTHENRKLFHNLSDGISEDLNEFQPVDAPDKSALLEQNSNIWEFLQPEEEFYEGEEMFPGLENGRWVTVEQEDAGTEDEKVLFRTFVNAAIGRKSHRMRSRGAPYMLLLSIKEGESEPKVTLCNQSGTLGLTRDFTYEDLQDKEVPTSPISGANLRSREAIPLNFGTMNVTVAFTNEEDLDNFMYIPRAYFEAVKRRLPRQLKSATETLLFSRSVEVFEMLKADTMKEMSPRQRYQSCDLRILETTCREGWRTTRRLVVSSSAGEQKPWCSELFLPLSRVQIRSDITIARKVEMKWSDCTHESGNKTDGSYNRIYTYIYDDHNPNIALSLLFRNAQDADDFERTVLQLANQPIYTWTGNSEAYSVYMVSDSEPNQKKYKALMLTRTRHDWKYSDLFYLYRDIDFVYDRAARRVKLPQLAYTDYISSHVDKLYTPPLDAPPKFSHCDKKIGHTVIDFTEESVAAAFMSSLTSDFTLIFSRRADYITTKSPPKRPFGSMKSNKGAAEVQLWLKGNSVRLISRWDDKVEDKWLSMAVPRHALDHKRDSNRASFPKLQYDRGRKIDMANLVARDSKERKEDGGKKVGPVTIAFETVRGGSMMIVMVSNVN